MPSLAQAWWAFLHFSSNAMVKVWPGFSTDLANLLSRRGQTTVTSRAASNPPDQQGIKTSAGLALVPGRRACSSYLGARLALTATW